MLEIAGDVAAAAAVFAGLVLVFFGASLASFETFPKTSRAEVRGLYRRRAWPAFLALLAAFASCGVSLFAKAAKCEVASYWGAGLLVFVALAIVVSAAQTMREIG